MLLGLGMLLWLCSIPVLLGGLVLLCIRAARQIGTYMVLGSFGMWVLSMGMCVVGRPENHPTAEKRDAGAPDAAPKPTTAPPADALLERERPPGGAWRRDDAGTTYSLDSPDLIDGWLSRKKPTLVVRCHERKTEVYVATDLYPAGETGRRKRHTVTLRFDAGSPLRELWSESTDEKALFAPNSEALARRLGRAQTLTFEFTPFNANPGTARFTLAGSDAVVASVAKACGWTP